MAGVDLSNAAALRDAVAKQRATLDDLRSTAPGDDDLTEPLDKAVRAAADLEKTTDRVNPADPGALAPFVDDLQKSSAALQDATQQVSSWLERNC